MGLELELELGLRIVGVGERMGAEVEFRVGVGIKVGVDPVGEMVDENNVILFNLNCSNA